MLIVVGLMALAAPLVSPHDPNAMKPAERLSEPGVASGDGTAYLLGTDFLGRDVLSRIIYGARVSLLVGVFAVLGAGSIGVVVGAIAGYYGQWVDEVLMRLVDMGLAVPGLLLGVGHRDAAGRRDVERGAGAQRNRLVGVRSRNPRRNPEREGT